MFKKATLQIESTVTNYLNPIANYGSRSENGAGLSFDRSTIVSHTNPRYSYSDYIGGYSYCLLDGTVAGDWQSGVSPSLVLSKLIRYKQWNLLKWIPKYKCGFYFINNKKIYLSSDFSYCERAEGIKLDIPVNAEAFWTNIWFRDGAIKKPYRNYSQVSNFSSPVERFNEFKYEDGSIVFNKKPFKSIGSSDFDEESWEGKGQATGFRYLFTKFFPLLPSSFKIVASDGLNQITLKESPNYDLEENQDWYYSIDFDLGVIKVGKRRLFNLISNEDIDNLTTSFRIKNSKDLLSYPDSGYLIYNGKRLYYENKNKSVCSGVIWNHSEIIPKGSELEFYSGTKDLDSSYVYYISYDAVPRVDIETENDLTRICNARPLDSDYLNVRPSANYENRGVVQLSTTDTHITRLDLRLENLEEMSPNYYEGLVFGSSYARAVAQALDSLDEGVPEIEITIVIESGPGWLNGAKSYTDTSNSNGEIESGYHAPYDWDDIRKKVVSSTYEPDRTLFQIEELPLNLANEDVQLYEVLKIDHNVGTVGELLSIEDTGIFYTNPDGTIDNSTYVKIEKVSKDNFDDLYSLSSIKIKNANGNGWISEKVSRILETNNHWYVFLKNNYNSNNISKLGDRCFLFRKGSLEWSANSRMGLNRLVYHWNEDTLHPITGATGSYYPLRPVQIANNIITYDIGLKEPDPYNPEERLGDYILVSSSMVTMYAYCTDPFTGQLIVSNTVRARIDIPRYLNGVDFTQSLPVPYGFRIIDNNEDVSSGIGGLNFLTVNPLVKDKLSLNFNIK